jgi:hypothetical protein
MAVSSGDLDGLLNVSFPVTDYSGLVITSATESGPLISAALNTVTVSTTGVPGPGGVSGDTYTVVAVDDANDSFTAQVSVSGTPVLQQTFYALGYTADAILVGDGPGLGHLIADTVLVGGGYEGFNASLGVISPSPLPAETSILFSASGNTTVLPCFAAGTRLTTPAGELRVEELSPGDVVHTQFGGPTPIKWIGYRTVDCDRHPNPRKVWPVRIRAGAFGPELRACDLYLSPDHAVYAENVLIPVRYLIDGYAIMQVPVARITYYHVELPRHDVVLAEGVTVESFLDTGGRAMFDNGGSPTAMHPDFATRIWEAEGCAPLVVAGHEVLSVKRSLKRYAAPRAA